jgi:hypothetical protein
MSKLFKLKEWLTVPEAARHLAAVFDEEVTESDVFRLGLDGHLTLSVDFVNGARGCLGKVVSKTDAEVKIFCRDIMNPLMRKARAIEATSTVGAIPEAQSNLPEEIRKAINERTLFWHITDLNIDDETFLHLDDHVSSIDGVWDLALIGSERLDVEHRFQQLTDGPEVEGVNLSGTFVKRDDGTYASLQESFDSPEMKALSGEVAQKLKDMGVKKDLKTRENKKPYDHPDNWFPAGALPTNSVLVVRTSALTELQTKMMETASVPPAKESTREKNTLLRIIALMANHRYSAEIENPFTIANHLASKAQELGVKAPSDGTIAEKIKAAVDLLTAERPDRRS